MDKPSGPTSHDVVARARRLFRTRTVGHCGTLDPFATGLLILVFGSATRLAQWVERHPKTYRAVVALGTRTDTDDRTGVVVERQVTAEWPTEAAVRGALARLTGVITQRPPAYSAKRIGGERSHRLARRGAAPEPEPVEVTVHRLELVGYHPPELTLEAVVSPGTYVRALGRDLGALLGTGAHLAELRRERIGPWGVAEATPLEALTGHEPLRPPLELVQGLPVVELTADEAARIRQGRPVPRDAAAPGSAALVAGGALVAVAVGTEAGWQPRTVLPPEEAR